MPANLGAIALSNVKKLEKRVKALEDYIEQNITEEATSKKIAEELVRSGASGITYTTQS